MSVESRGVIAKLAGIVAPHSHTAHPALLHCSLDAHAVAVAVPCGHRTMCAGCAALTWRRGVRECVICRTALQGLVVPGQATVA